MHFEAGVVIGRAYTRGNEHFGYFPGSFARSDIDYGRAVCAVENGDKFGSLVFGDSDKERYVRTCETAREYGMIPQ